MEECLNHMKIRIEGIDFAKTNRELAQIHNVSVQTIKRRRWDANAVGMSKKARIDAILAGRRKSRGTVLKCVYKTIDRMSKRMMRCISKQPIRPKKTYRQYDSLHDALWDRVAIKGKDECWEWIGSHTGAGYGQFTYKSVKYATHILAYQLSKGSKAVLNVCHTCDNRKCCNPSHLWEGSQSENMLDASSKGRLIHPEFRKHKPIQDIPCVNKTPAHVTKAISRL